MEPVAQTAEALRALARRGEESLDVELRTMAQRVRALVPELIGLTLGLVEDWGTLTLAASTEELAALDAVQYLDGGPCVADLDRDEPVEVDIIDLLGEDRWRFYARASAAAGVTGSLTLPVIDGGSVVGGVNLYASTPDAFSGLHDVLAETIGPAARLAVADAELSFRALKAAMEAPTRVREGGDINVALSIISAGQGVNIPIARERLRNAAVRAGVSEAQAAKAIKPIRF